MALPKSKRARTRRRPSSRWPGNSPECFSLSESSAPVCSQFRRSPAPPPMRSPRFSPNARDSANEGQIGDVVRLSLLESMRKRYQECDGRGFVCFEDIGDCRRDYVKEVLQEELGELTALDQEVVESLREREIITSNVEKQFERKLTFGERLSDRIASFGGSWRFLITFAAVIFVWIGANVVLLATKAFDPYPFILLNLILSCLAAVQAPVIMMSQNRSEARDRLRAENDYKVN